MLSVDILKKLKIWFTKQMPLTGNIESLVSILKNVSVSGSISTIAGHLYYIQSLAVSFVINDISELYGVLPESFY